jgi:redox-sensitive bicupin YhaK (pirin superfamily)
MTKKSVTNIEPLGFQWKARDPFLFCVHHEDFFPKGNENMGPDAEELKGRQIGQDFIIKDGWRMYHGSTVPGFPSHPHRGFETVTVVRKGMVDHSDSLGGAGRYGDGDVQWMTAGKGVQHAEMFPLIKQDEENPMELFQIWLNLPKANKFVNPHYKMLWNKTIPIHTHEDKSGKKTKIEVIAGKIENDTAPLPPPDSWAANTTNEVAIWNIQMEAGSIWELPKASAGVNRTLYFYKGDLLKVDGTDVVSYHSAELIPEELLKLEAGNEPCNILILQGKPIAEPVVQHGPFVMNTKQEIQQAFADYQQTQFGGWPWSTHSPVHDLEKGRFALHANGELEDKG